MNALLIFGVFLVSMGLTYVWWVKVRVVCLRQDIFDIRDELFDDARRLNALSDPAYKSARVRLNMIAKTADFLSVPAVIFVGRMLSGKEYLPPCSENAEVQAAINKATKACTDRLTKYLMRQTVGGWLVTTMTYASRIGLVADETGKYLISAWVLSPSSEKLANARRRYRQARHHGGAMTPVGMNGTRATGLHAS